MKTTLILPFIIFISICCSVSCENNSGEIPIINIDNPTGAVALHISDILDDITIVPLETRDDVLLSFRTPFIITAHYILAQTEERLLQFDRQGKFIRVLATNGNGPNEYNAILHPLVDEDLELLYYVDYRNQGTIASIHLRTGAFLGPFTPDLQPFSIHEIDSDGYIYGFRPSLYNFWSDDYEPSSGPRETPVLAYRYHPQSSDLILFNGTHSFEGGYTSEVAGGSRMFKRDNHIYFIILNYSDTLYRVEGSKIVPHSVFNLKNKTTHPRYGGSSLRFHFACQQGIMFSKVEQKFSFKENGTVSASVGNPSFLFLDNNNILCKVNSITIDPLGVTINMDGFLTIEGRNTPTSKIPNITGLYGHLKIEAYDLIALINNTLKDNRISNDLRKQFEELSTTLHEDDNPVLIIGKVK